jgi:hypothetical protein
MGLPPSGDTMQYSPLFRPDALNVSPMLERDFWPLGGCNSPVSAQQLNLKGQESYSNAVRKSPSTVTLFVPLGSNLDNPMSPYLPPPAGRRTKINEDKNEYQVMCVNLAFTALGLSHDWPVKAQGRAPSAAKRCC